MPSIGSHVMQMLQSGAIWAIGDLTAQSIHWCRRRPSPSSAVEAERLPSASSSLLEHIDWDRTRLSAFYGGCIFSPVAGRWYRFVVSRFPQTTASSIGKRLVVDQLLWSPFALAMYFSVMAFLHEGLHADAAHRAAYQLKHVLPSTLVTGWVYWVPVQAMNFFYIPSRHWLLVVNATAVPWTAFLSLTQAQT